MRKTLLSLALAGSLIGSSWIGAGPAGAAPSGCNVPPSQKGGHCSYKATGGSGGWSVNAKTWNITVNGAVVAGSAKKSAESGNFKKNHPKNASVVLTITGQGFGGSATF
jgi:hypothetical protein